MSSPEEERAPFRRIYLFMLGLAIAGIAGCWIWQGFRGAASFVAGGAISMASFWSLQQVGPVLTGKAGGARVVFLSFRLLLLFAFAYAILNIYEGFCFLPATACGLLLSVTAITLETVYQLIYARA